MADALDEFSRLGNFHQIARVLTPFAAGNTIAWLDLPPQLVCKAWFDLGSFHLSEARRSLNGPQSWRTVVSRSYYAVYNVSKAVRYYVSGSVKRDMDDHKQVGDLPNDFPGRDLWSNQVTELRRDRNIADYEPWSSARNDLAYTPSDSVDKAGKFLQACKKYLSGRGVKL